MKDVNKVILVGRVGVDPVQRATKNGTSVVNFPLATSRWVKDAAAEGVEGEATSKGDETQWHRIVVWGKQGEVCAQHLKKGEPVYVEGSLRSRQYTLQDGSKRMAFEVHAENVSFLKVRRAEPTGTMEAPAAAEVA
jgi:single-strand DNA-binding protein